MIKDPAFAEKRAKDVLELVKAGYYINQLGKFVDIKNDVANAVGNTEFLTPDIYPKRSKSFDGKLPVLSITNESSTAAAHRFVSNSDFDKVAVLNFASYKNPGGGFIRGASAQEEDLCRSSCLYHCLRDQKEFYMLGSQMGTDNILYSHDVVFFKDENYVNLEKPFVVDIITCAAPNISGQPELQNSTEIVSILNRRIKFILDSAVLAEARELVLGAWGCGVFGNDPRLVANIFKNWLESETFKGCFDNIVFAVLDKSPDKTNFNTFQKVFL